MSREIKFRAWDTVDIGIGDIDHMRYDIDLNWAKRLNLDIMQYTGLKDKNGTEVYDADIIEDFQGRRFRVFFCETHHRWELKGDAESGFNYEASINDWFDDLSDLPEIIGNVHKDKELLT